MAATTDLTTKARIKTLLDITASTWDDVIEQLIDGNTLFIQKYCDALFLNDSNDKTEYFDGGVSTLQVKAKPIASVSSVSLRSGDLYNPTWNAYSSSGDYYVNATKGVLHFNFTLPIGFSNIRVVYKGGYTTPSTNAPSDLKLACERMVVKEFNHRKSIGALNESVGGASVQWEKEAMDETTRQLLAPYRNISI